MSNPANTPAVRAPRRHDLDALRAAAMLLGIVYHAALSFAIGPAWMAEDVSQSTAAYVFQSWVHGFRMPLFMLVSGYFTAMLWRQKGLKALLRHRCQRVLLPCLAGLVTVVPAIIAVSNHATQTKANQALAREEARIRGTGPDSLWSAIRLGDLPAIARHASNLPPAAARHPASKMPAVAWAAAMGQLDAARWLSEHGASIHDAGDDGSTALHVAAFLGHDALVEWLLQKGADPLATNRQGENPAASARHPASTVRAIAGFLAIPVHEDRLAAGRQRLLPMLEKAMATHGPGIPPSPTTHPPSSPGPSALAGAWKFLTETPVFILVWFLWFLVWLVAIFAALAWLGSRLPIPPLPTWVTLSRWRWAWLVPLTAVPAWFMSVGQGEFGPDTVMGIVPKPHVLAYYATFFFFGVVHHDHDAGTPTDTRAWRWALPLTVLGLFPAALEASTGILGLRGPWGSAPWHRPAAVLLQSAFAWAMTFSCIGLFRACVTRENPAVRYLSDSAYWMYLAHLPPTILLQSWISPWPLPAWLKLPILSAVLVAGLLASYHLLVRDQPMGWFLNGRPKPARRTA